MELSTRHIMFCQNIIAGMSNKDAYEAAGLDVRSKQRGNPVSDQSVSRLYHRPEIQEKLRELLSQRLSMALEKPAVMDLNERKEILTLIARSRLADYLDENGDIDLSKIDNPAVAELVTTHFQGGKEGRASQISRKLKIRNPMEAIDLLNKMERLYQDTAPMEVNVNVVNVLSKLRGYKPRELEEPVIESKVNEV